MKKVLPVLSFLIFGFIVLACGITNNVTNVYVACCSTCVATPTAGIAPTATESLACSVPSKTPFVFPPTRTLDTNPTDRPPSGGTSTAVVPPSTGTPLPPPTVIPSSTPIPPTIVPTTAVPPTTIPPTIVPTNPPCDEHDGDGEDDCNGHHDDDNGHDACNQGVGNKSEGCDPGNSNNNQGSNDENGGIPGNPGRGHNGDNNNNDHQPGTGGNDNSGSNDNSNHGNDQGDHGHGQILFALMPV